MKWKGKEIPLVVFLLSVTISVIMVPIVLLTFIVFITPSRLIWLIGIAWYYGLVATKKRDPYAKHIP